ncbi:di-heme oxidoredictase family protein [Marinomonas sp. 2405UD68-3]|uniref:di-heme oxidoredictase family protein n=1 Tax=Marinomonas sp. 2405UD68-3 TaxID=3391835 RepID=UPI0039C906EF
MAAPLKAGFFASLIFLSLSFCSHPIHASTLTKNNAKDTEFSPVLGQAIFEKLWVSSPSSTLASDGLGPLFNARSCLSCHLQQSGGRRPEHGESTADTTAFLLRLGLTHPTDTPEQFKPNSMSVLPDSTYGHQLQTKSVHAITVEPSFIIQYSNKALALDDGTVVTLQAPHFYVESTHDTATHSQKTKDTEQEPLPQGRSIRNKTIENSQYFDSNTRFSARLAPHLTGMGLIDALPESAILANADPDDANNDGISGKANIVWDRSSDTWQVGRFGYKATQPTLDQQNQSAFNGDIGLSTPLFSASSGDCTTRQERCLHAPNGNSAHLDNLEINQQQLNWVNIYLGTLPVARINNIKSPQFKRGRQQFIDLNCLSCHVPKFTTTQSRLSATLENRVIFPFSDFLLHDMGDALASEFNEYNATPNEWRTAPLWGISERLKQNPNGGFLHDGRARNVNEAILWHGGEAAASQAAYRMLNTNSRRDLLYFLESL